jgi:uncharacterized hydrophobic protein (TIGR00271 family)
MRDSVRADAGLTVNFIVLTVGAAAIATLGLLENNPAVIIGAMIISPLILPIGSLSFAAVSGDVATLRRGAGMLAAGGMLSLLLALIITRIFFLPTLGTQILGFSQPNLLDLGVALFAGLITAFARMRPSVAGTIAGTAIAVALLPPICVAGIGLAHGMWALTRGSGLLFATNLLGIMLASMSVYIVGGYVHLRRAGHGLLWTALATATVVIPLAASTHELIRQAMLQAALRSALVNGTVTFHRADLIRADFDWLTSPPRVHLLVRSDRAITPVQVQMLEAFAKRKTGTDFKLIFAVTRYQEVQDVPAAPTSAPVYPGVLPTDP